MLHISGMGYISSDSKALSSKVPHELLRLQGAFFVDVTNGDIRPEFSQGFTEDPPQSPGPPSDQSNLSIELKETGFRLFVLVQITHFSFPAKALKKGM
jgi:hypothetical protein